MPDPRRPLGSRRRALVLVALGSLAACGAPPTPSSTFSGGAPALAAAPPVAGEPRPPLSASAPPAPWAPPLAPTPPPASAAPAPPAPPSATGSRTWLKGQLHAHSSGSYDGRAAPDEVLGFYARRGYDFVALTDHNHVTLVTPPPGLLFIPGAELTQNSASCAPAPPPGYRCLIHMGALFVEPGSLPGGRAALKLPFQEQRSAAFQQELELIQRLGAVPVLNHPSFHFAADAPRVARLARSGVVLVELFNAAVDRQSPEGVAAAHRRAERLWDEVLEAGALVYALATDDAHHFADVGARRRAGRFVYDAGHAFVMVRAEREVASVRRALLAGDFYASTGLLFSDLTLTRRLLRVQVQGEAPARFRFTGRRGRVLQESHGLEATYEPRGDEGWVRVSALRGDGARAYTQPVVP